MDFSTNQCRQLFQPSMMQIFQNSKTPGNLLAATLYRMTAPYYPDAPV